jgi:acyl-coenzyme A thioesterase PaaI-like protein
MCFGCGPANTEGLRIKSFVRDKFVVAQFMPAPYHIAFEGMINGGIIGVLLDCHMNWTAAWSLMTLQQLETPPCTVTAEYKVQFALPTPADQLLQVSAWVVDQSERKSVIEATLSANQVVTAKGSGTFVAVRPGHPAYHRW